MSRNLSLARLARDNALLPNLSARGRCFPKPSTPHHVTLSLCLSLTSTANMRYAQVDKFEFRVLTSIMRQTPEARMRLGHILGTTSRSLCAYRPQPHLLLTVARRSRGLRSRSKSFQDPRSQNSGQGQTPHPLTSGTLKQPSLALHSLRAVAANLQMTPSSTSRVRAHYSLLRFVLLPRH
jgi:hypothetical protein